MHRGIQPPVSMRPYLSGQVSEAQRRVLPSPPLHPSSITAVLRDGLQAEVESRKTDIGQL